MVRRSGQTVDLSLPDAVTITSQESLHTPRALVGLINLLRLTNTEGQALSSHRGDVPEPIVYTSSEKIDPCTIQAVDRCLQRGFRLSDAS